MTAFEFLPAGELQGSAGSEAMQQLNLKHGWLSGCTATLLEGYNAKQLLGNTEHYEQHINRKESFTYM